MRHLLPLLHDTNPHSRHMHLWKGMCRRHILQNTPNSPSAEPDLGKEKKQHLLPFKCYDNRLFRNSIVLKVPWHCWIGVLYFPGTSVWNVLFYNHNHKEVFEYYFLGTVDKLEQSLKMDGLSLEVTESAEHTLHTKIKSNSKIMFFRRLYFRNLLLKWYQLW